MKYPEFEIAQLEDEIIDAQIDWSEALEAEIEEGALLIEAGHLGEGMEGVLIVEP